MVPLVVIPLVAVFSWPLATHFCACQLNCGVPLLSFVVICLSTTFSPVTVAAVVKIFPVTAVLRFAAEIW